MSNTKSKIIQAKIKPCDNQENKDKKRKSIGSTYIFAINNFNYNLLKKLWSKHEKTKNFTRYYESFRTKWIAWH